MAHPLSGQTQRLRADEVTERDAARALPEERAARGGRVSIWCRKSSSDVPLHAHADDLSELSAGLRARRFSSVELTRTLLERIERHNGALNAFLTVTEPRRRSRRRGMRMRRCRRAAAVRSPASRSRTRTSSAPTASAPPAARAFSTISSRRTTRRWSRGLKAAGVVLLGKTNMDEFAMGSSNETSYYGRCATRGTSRACPAVRRAGRRLRSRRGSCPAPPAPTPAVRFASPPRSPASPASSRLTDACPRYGMIAFASSLDQAGVLTQSAQRMPRSCSAAMAGFDPRDSTSVDAPVPDYVGALDKPLKGLRDRPAARSSSTRDSTRACAELRAGCARSVQARSERTTREVSLPHLPLSVPTYYVVAPAECSSNLSRFDGVRFGHRCENPRDLLDLYKRSRGEGFGAEVKRRIMTGTYVLSAGYYDAYYLKAQKVRQLISDDFRRAFEAGRRADRARRRRPRHSSSARRSTTRSRCISTTSTPSARISRAARRSMPCGFVECPAGGPADHRAGVQRSAAAQCGASLPAGNRLAPASARAGTSEPWSGKPSSVWRSTRSSPRAPRSFRARRLRTARRPTRRRISWISAIRACCRC